MKSNSKISGRNFHGSPGYTRVFSIMYRLAIMILCVIFISGCSCARIQKGEDEDVHLTGRQRLLRALNPSRLCVSFFGRSGLLSTALPSSRLSLCKPLRELEPDGSHSGSRFAMDLKDGTRVGGLFFEYDDGTSDPKPLLMASFGFLQDRWGTEAAKFYDLYLKDPSARIPAHVLILDHPTAGTFLASNNHLSMGSYDDARMWIEIVLKIREDMVLSGIHLFGVSMSGQTVVHALIEDARLGLDLFDSGMAVSIAPDFQKAPGKQLAQLKTSKGTKNPWAGYYETVPKKTFVDMIQGQGLWMLMKKQFVPHYRYVKPEDTEFDLKRSDVAVFLRRAFEERITRLRKHIPDTWNREDFSLEDLDAFMSSTRIAGVIGRVRTPLVLVSAFDDPAVQRAMFEEVMLAAKSNPWIAAFETEQGGHFGFNMPYGKDYIGGIIRLMIDPQVLHTWNGPKNKADAE